MKTKSLIVFSIIACAILIACKKNKNVEIQIPPVIVTDADLHGWVKEPKGLALVDFYAGPSTPLLGKGSMRFTSPDKSIGRLRNTQYSGTPLSSITELSYSHFIEQRDSTVDANGLHLLADIDGDGVKDITIIFEPRYQTGKFVAGTSIPDQGNSEKNKWQTWDALHGGWFVFVSTQTDPDHGGVLSSLPDLIKKYPGATIVNDQTGVGGLRLQAGGPIFSNNFIGYVDNIKIGVNGITTTYDFE
ncbi:MAG: hypothetical protein M3004_02715 [Bacteroidota bacterium]|nr:hypothetical protein [Bacteroidota bacterium]